MGVTGHRQDQLGEDGARLADEVRTVLESIETIFAVRGGPRLVSALATGADSIATDAALALGWKLDVVLPATRAVYAGDFPPGEERAAFSRRLGAAANIFELPCDAGLADAVHYERAGRVMLDQCDMLLAVWDGQPARGRGGTGQIVVEAIVRQMPVVVVCATGGPVTILWSGFHPQGLDAAEPGAIDAVPFERIGEIAAAMRCPAPTSRDRVIPRSTWAGPVLTAVYPLLLAVMGVRRFRLADVRHGNPARARGAAVAPAARNRPAHRYAEADAEATYMAKLYRGGFIANFSLSALAVLSALAGLVVPQRIGPFLSIAEVLAIACILWMTHHGRRHGWHERWIEQRHLAERLRCLALSARLGDLRVSFGKPETQSDAELRGIARGLGIPPVVVDQGYVTAVRREVSALIDEQIAYNETNWHRMHMLDHRLHAIGTVLFVTAAGVSLASLLLEVAVRLLGSHALETLSLAMKPVTVMLSGALPTIGAAIYGIRMQGDFGGGATRARVLAAALRPVRAKVEKSDGLSVEAGFDELRQCTSLATRLMTAELTDWRAIHVTRPLTLPG